MISEIVSKQEYEVWIRMLKKLEKSIGINELAVFVALILEYTWSIADERYDENHEPSKEFIGFGDLIRDYGKERINIFKPLLEKLFSDAGISFIKRNKAGEENNIIVASIEECLSWEYL